MDERPVRNASWLEGAEDRAFARPTPASLRLEAAQIRHDGVEVSGRDLVIIAVRHGRLQALAVRPPAGDDGRLDIFIAPAREIGGRDVARHRLAPRPVER